MKTPTNTYNLKGKKLYIFPLSDLHLGSPACNLEYFHYWEEIFKKTRSKNKIIYLLGDMIDTPNLRIGSWEFNMTCDEQVNRLTHLLKPYKKYIRYMVTGNHPARLRRDYNLDLGEIVSKNLEVPYNRTDFFDTLNINDQPFTIYGKHGTRFSKSIRLAERGFITDMNTIDANLCMQGHNHYGSFFTNVYRAKNGGVGRRYYTFTGHFLNYFKSYAIDKGMTISPESFTRLNINKNLKVSGDEYHVDQERPDLVRI
jgi:hypothetical protein